MTLKIIDALFTKRIFKKKTSLQIFASIFCVDLVPRKSFLWRHIGVVIYVIHKTMHRFSTMLGSPPSGATVSVYLEPWGRHQMERFSTLLAICKGNSPVTGDFPPQRPMTRNFDVFFDLRLNNRFSKQSWTWWFETPSRSLLRHCNVTRPVHWLILVAPLFLRPQNARGSIMLISLQMTSKLYVIHDHDHRELLFIDPQIELYLQILSRLQAIFDNNEDLW